MTDKKYNGWTNFETWKVNLEMFDGWDNDGQDVTPDSLQEIAENHLAFGVEDNSLALSYALAFISEVNWHEIAEHINEE
ncbi:hypothetical protein N9878_00690 [bacterium]|nr:hypothetical protein [bacterium]